MKNKIRNMIILMTVLVLAFSMTACGGSDGDSKESTKEKADSNSGKSKSVAVIEPSELISKEEAESIMGVKYHEVKLSEEPRVGSKICVYVSENSENMFEIALTQQAFMPAGQKSTPEDIYRGIKDLVDATEVEGIGDEACFVLTGLHFMKDGYYIQVSVGLFDEFDQDKLKQAGELAIKNLEARL